MARLNAAALMICGLAPMMVTIFMGCGLWSEGHFPIFEEAVITFRPDDNMVDDRNVEEFASGNELLGKRPIFLAGSRIA